jgi:signal transduction histidine kinase
MTSQIDRHKAVIHLAVSIRLQRARRQRQLRDSQLLGDLDAENVLLSELQRVTRQKLARELHDGLTQTVSTLSMRVNYTRRLMGEDMEAALEQMHKVEDLVRISAKEIRYIIFTLHPVNFESKGLSAALESLAAKLQELFDLQIHLSFDQDCLGTIPLLRQQLIYLLIEETLELLRRRGDLSQLWLKLTCDHDGQINVVFEPITGFTEAGQSLEDDRQLDDLRAHVKSLGGIVNVKSAGEQGHSLQLRFPLDAVS